MKRITALLFAVLMLAAVLAVPAWAADDTDPNEELSLTVQMVVDDDCADDVMIRLYRVAEMDEDGDLSYTPAFATCGAGKLVDLTQEQSNRLCEKLYAFLDSKKSILPTASGKTDKFGELTLPGKGGKLERGLYLVTSERFYVNGESHEAQPFLVCLPYRSEKTGYEWDYDISVMPKLADTRADVIKIWQDKGYESKRPKEVKVELLQGEAKKVYATATLNGDNGWYYLWKDLPGGYTWSVREVTEVENYTTYVDRIPGGFRIINTYTPPPGKTLPQTGLLWWPVPVLACAGLLLFVLGWTKQRKREE